MTPLNLKAAVRHLWKNKLFSTVNIIGLSVGLASVMALLIGVYMYMTSDSMHINRDRMYYLKSTDKEGKQFMQTTYPLLNEILKTCPEVEAGNHTQSWSNPWLKSGKKEAQENTMYADTGFFRIFNFPLKYGNPATALKDKFSVVISEKVAGQLFGREAAVGKIITSDDKVQLTITGVLETIPVNSSVRSEVFLTTALLKDYPGFLSSANWYNGFALNFLKLRPGSSVAAFDAKVAKLVSTNYVPGRKTDKVLEIPFSNMRNEAGPIINIIIKGSIGTALFVLLTILVNLLNLNTTGIYNRGKEVAVRQMVGSSEAKIIQQFCLENGILVFSSVILATLLFTNILLPQLNNMYGSRFGDLSISLRKAYPFAALFIVVGIIIMIVAGILPALKLVSIRISDAVKGKIAGTGNNRRIRNIFIAFQFTFAIIFNCITVILNRQIDFMKNAATGFKKDDVAVASLDLAFKNNAAAAHFETITSELKSDPRVESISVAALRSER